MQKGCLVAYDKYIKSILSDELMRSDFTGIDGKQGDEKNIDRLYSELMLCLLYNAKDKIQKAIDEISPNE